MSTSRRFQRIQSGCVGKIAVKVPRRPSSERSISSSDTSSQHELFLLLRENNCMWSTSLEGLGVLLCEVDTAACRMAFAVLGGTPSLTHVLLSTSARWCGNRSLWVVPNSSLIAFQGSASPYRIVNPAERRQAL